MVGKDGQSGKGAPVGNLGVRGRNGRGSKRLLEGKSVRVVGNEVVMRGSQKDSWEVCDGLVEVDGGWENGEVFIRREGVLEKKVIGKEKGVGNNERLEEENGSRDVAMKLEEGKTMEGDGLGDSRFTSVERGLGEVRRSLVGGLDKGKGVERSVKKEKIDSVAVVEEVEEEEGVDSLEVWKLKRLRKEGLEKEERKMREKEGMVSRGKDMGRSREEVKRLRKDFRNWKEEVEEIRYIMGVIIIIIVDHYTYEGRRL